MIKDKMPKVVTDLMQRVTYMDSIANALSGLGTIFDSGTQARPDPYRTALAQWELSTLYTFCDVVRIGCDEFRTQALKKGWTLRIDGAKKEQNPFAEYEKDHKIKTKLKRAMSDARLFGAGLILAVVDDGLDPREPLDPRRIRSVINLVPLNRWEVTISDYYRDLLAPDYNEPLYYQIHPQLAQGFTKNSSNAQKIHASRFFRLDGVQLDAFALARNNGFHGSFVDLAWDPIRHLVSSEQAVARIIDTWEIGVFEMSDSAAALASEDPDVASLSQSVIATRFSLMQRAVSLLNSLVVDPQAGENYKRLPSQAANLDKLVGTQIEAVARSFRMSVSRLFGRAPAGLNSDNESGLQNDRDQIQAHQTDQAQPALEWMYSLEQAARGRTEEPVQVDFPAIDEQDAQTEAQTRFVIAQTDKIYAEIGSRTSEQIAQSRDTPDGYSEETTSRNQIDDPDLDERDHTEVVNISPPFVGTENTLADASASVLTPPQGVREAARRGLDLVEKGQRGSGLEAATIREARDLAAGKKIGLTKASKVIRFWARNERFLDEPKDSAAWTSALLWGGRPGVAWARALKEFTDSKSDSDSKRTSATYSDVFDGASDPKLPDRIKGFALEDRQRWVAIFNRVFRDTPGNKREKDNAAFRIANASLD